MKAYIIRLIAAVMVAALCLPVLSGCGPEQPQITTFPLPTGPEESEIFVAPVENISDSFIRGMDASAVLAEENSGVVYYNEQGQSQDVFMTLAQAGVNYIRLRVWNDPYDAQGHGYGGGNNDVPTAIALGKRATQYGMKVCIDFHYSDFWADPKKQFAPKAWEGMTLEEKSQALYDFTKDSLQKLLDEGVDVGMVQIGNEINNGMSGETRVSAVMELLKSGSRAVREISQANNRQIQIAVHYTDIHNEGGVEGILKNLKRFEVDYDVFAMSYYPFWHGTLENMQRVSRLIQETYGKQVVIAETSYCYTSQDGDGTGNSVSGATDLVEGYGATVQSQATMIRDICAAANEAGVLGVFYWEGTWIPVGPTYEANFPIWEEHGSGWASSYSADYDPNDAGKYYGGCSWDNQAMFDFEGHPLPSLNVFKFLKYGATAPLKVENVPKVVLESDVGTPIRMPETIRVVYNDPGAPQTQAVTWDEKTLAAIDTAREGTHTVPGTLADGTAVSATVVVKLLNHAKNPSFEEEDKSMWTVTWDGNSNPTDYQVKADDAHSGKTAFHFWSGSGDMDFSIQQTVTGLEPGLYRLTAYAQGGDMSADSKLALYAISGGQEQTAAFTMNGYANWQNPTITEIRVTDGTLTFGVRMQCNVGSWGTVDDFTLNRISD